MARPQREIIRQAQDEANVWSIIDIPDYWIITYNDRPITIRTENVLNGYKKYKRTSYSTEASARGAALRLNELFATDAFGYRRG